MEPIWGVFFAPIPTLPPWYFITPKKNHLAINWGTPFGGYWQDKSRILDKCGLFACVAACVLRCGLCRCVLRVFVVACVFALSCAAFCLCGTSRKGKRGATRGKRPWGFPPRAFRADKCGRSTHDPRFPSGESSLFFKNINIFREAALPERLIVFLIKLLK